jgi:hypothetical protein
MPNKLQQSFAFRSGPIYQQLCKLLPKPNYTKGNLTPFRFLSMTGSKHLDMLNQCLISLHKTWDHRPELIIYSDGSVSSKTISKSFAWWKGPIQIGSQEDILTWTATCGFESLNTFALKEAVGRKLACILKEASSSPVLWCDTDILWFKPLQEFYKETSVPLKVSQDYQWAYDGYISEKCPEILKDPPYINTGLVYLNSPIQENHLLQNWLNQVGEKPNHFTEQTFLAIAAKILESPIWDMEEIACLQSDRFMLKPSYKNKNWFARHYVGPVRHLFWKDAFYSRILPIK